MRLSPRNCEDTGYRNMARAYRFASGHKWIFPTARSGFSYKNRLKNSQHPTLYKMGTQNMRDDW